MFVGCLTSQQHASVSQGRICSDKFTCCHTEIEVAAQTFHLTQSQFTETGPTSPSTVEFLRGEMLRTELLRVAMFIVELLIEKLLRKELLRKQLLRVKLLKVSERDFCEKTYRVRR